MEATNYLLPRLDPNQGCTKATCEASQSIYGYEPNLAATVIFLILFATSGLIHLWQGITTRTYFFSIAMAIGCLASVIGYIAKILLHDDPFSDIGFKMSVVVLTFAPAFFAAGIYYTLKHICLTFGSSFSRLRPSMYTTVFISCDLFSIVLQAIGGGLASASTSMTILRVGDNVMIAGLAFQVATMVAFGALAADYGLAVRRNRSSLNSKTEELRDSLRFKLFLAALWIAYLCVLVRCCYRLAELAKGWSEDNEILRNEDLFIGLDSVTCGIATLILNFWHPGWCFPKEQQEIAEKISSTNDSSDLEAVVGTDFR
ncbi:related to phospholipid-translocating ATPase [Ramularia collo-cygni]|uniref:Related to phospholipid-translocating ATPase n=1 Tax=Ramularia collo-cygni TaxID=112498 RepID=A0A2D3UNN9_9PEZI|nr:related to phospholipid-translocating ATPase [Ramularia collo-cygni]CZT17752.1 related to phospholipid-translocating ATPase [Ramularia collo-cygni]